MWRTLQRIDAVICRCGLIAGGAVLVILMGLTGANVLMRLVGKPLGAVYELGGYCGALAVAFVLADTQRTGGHITVDLFTAKLPPRARAALTVLNSLLFALFFLVIAYQLCCRAMNVRATGEVSETLKLAYHPFVFCVAGGFATLALSLLASALRAILPPSAS
jgi:TRAP-type C4-dicarboxylate transport system permease small subunit